MTIISKDHFQLMLIEKIDIQQLADLHKSVNSN